MIKIIPATAKVFSGNTKVVAPAFTISNVKYSTNKEATIELKPYKLHKLEKGPPTSTTLTSEDALTMLRQLLVLRKAETSCDRLYKKKMIRGFCHLYSGQEAIAVGMVAVMRKKDTVITSYRCHGWTHLMGVSVAGVLSELTGRRLGCSRGKGGSMHMYAKNFYGGNGIVGAQTPLGTGVAFAHKYSEDGGVCFTLYGDGAANQGQLYESFNIAKLWNLPCVFVCENNIYGLGTKIDRSSASIDYYARADYIPGIWADGMDVLTAREATRFAIEYSTSGKGPIVVQMETYRYTGHSMSDPGTSYRTREEVAEVRKTRDPITTFKEKLLASQLVTEEQFKEIDASVRKETAAAVKVCTAEPEIGPEELTTDIYYKSLEPVIRGVHPGAPLKHGELAPRTLKA